MKSAKLILLLVFCAVAVVSQERAVIIQTSTLLDGRGHLLRDMQIVVQNGKILRVEKSSGAATYNLRGMTVLPGWIDVHDHLTWHFGPNGSAEDKGETEAQAAQAAAANTHKPVCDVFIIIPIQSSP